MLQQEHSCTLPKPSSWLAPSSGLTTTSQNLKNMLRKTKILPRGLRNNNPLNIRIGNTWLGERSNPTDSEFEEFVTIEYGYRAAFCILRRYIRRFHKNTVTAIISTWAPSSENNTIKYIDTVCNLMNIQPDTPIDYADKQTMVSLAAAMTFVECGQKVDEKKISLGYDMA